MVKPAIGPAPQRIFTVDLAGVLRPWPGLLEDGATVDIAQAPYGAVVLPHTRRTGTVTVVFKQPGARGRSDVLVIERPVELRIGSSILGEANDPRNPGIARARIEMSDIAAALACPPDTCAVVQFLTSELDLLRLVRYTIRAGDEPGWFEFGEAAFPDAQYVHGFPDIASRCQTTAGIRGPSCLLSGLDNGVSPSHIRPLRPRPVETFERIIYELHIGTFTAEGTFDAAASRLSDIAARGITTVQLMPVDVGSGAPGWTYDQARTGAVEPEAYGGPPGLIRFVERAHELGLEVIVDKQYNHAGPEQDSRGKFINGMFKRSTQWGAGVSGDDAAGYKQIAKLTGEEIAFWIMHYGIDGLRLDATNRLPWELHNAIAGFIRSAEKLAGKPLYAVSEYSECEGPIGRRVPTGHQYTDQTGRFLMKLLQVSDAPHVFNLPVHNGSLLRAMLIAAKRGWWYPDLHPPDAPLRGSHRVTTLVWHHDWIGNRFGGERLNQLVPFPLFKTILAWQFLGQWTPLVFMGTESCAETPWFYFNGHRDTDTRNNTSAYYAQVDGEYVLTGGRFHEFAREASAAGLREPLAFSSDGTPAGIDWLAFRSQRDVNGRLYMDPSNMETFENSKLDWSRATEHRAHTERLFAKLASVRALRAAQSEDVADVQYKAWSDSERVFVLRRRESRGTELIGLFNLGSDIVDIAIREDGVDAQGCGEPCIVPAEDSQSESDWPAGGCYELWLDTNAELYGGGGAPAVKAFVVEPARQVLLRLAEYTALIFHARRRADA